MSEITDIQRWAGSAPGRSRMVAYGGLIWAVAEGSVGDIQAQTADCLRRLEHQLAEVGSAKTRLLSVQIFLSDLALKDAMNAVWTEWIGADPKAWPQRACVAAGLEGQTLRSSRWPRPVSLDRRRAAAATDLNFGAREPAASDRRTEPVVPRATPSRPDARA